MCLINIIENGNLESKPIAKNLLNLVDHEFICLLTVCNSILSSIDCVNVFLQKKKTMTVCQTAKMVQGLIKEITDLRNNRIQVLFQDAEQIIVKMNISPSFLEKRKKSKKMDFDESADEWNVSAKNNCIINLKNVCDVLLTHLDWRFETLNNVSLDFSFLTGSELFEKETGELVKAAADLALKYNKDLNASELTEEIIHFKHHAISSLPKIKSTTPLELIEVYF